MGSRHVRARQLVAAAIAIALITPLPFGAAANALSGVSISGTGTGTGLSPANAAPAGSFTPITAAPVITETAATTISTGKYSFVPPAGFEFGGTPPTASFSTAGGAACALTVSTPAIAGGAIAFTIGGTVLATTTCRLTFAGIQARPLSAGPFTGVVPGGVITLSTSTGSTITGITMGMTSFGFLYETAPSLMVTPATGGSAISANTAVGGSATTWTTLTGPAFTEPAAGMLTGGAANGLFGFSPPQGFEFQVQRSVLSVATSAAGPGACALTASVYSQAADVTMISVSGGPSTSGNLCKLTVTGLAVRPTATHPLALGPIVEWGASPGIAFPTASFGMLNEVAGAATSLALYSPSSCRAGSVCSNAPVASVFDAYGNTVNAQSVPITLAFGANPTGATISGVTNPTSTSGGFARWPNFSVDLAGSGYTLTASSPGLTTATSQAFNVGYGTCGSPSSNTSSCVDTFRVDATGSGSWADLRSSTTTFLDVNSYAAGQLQATVTMPVGSTMPQDILRDGTYTTGSVFDIGINLGTFDPVATAFTGDVIGNSVTFTPGAGGNLLHYQAHPRPASWADNCQVFSCGGPTTVATRDISGQVLAGFGDMNAPPGLTPAQLANFNTFRTNAHGSWIATNAQAFSFPHQDQFGGFTFDIAAPHFKADGVTVNTGFFTAFIPDSLVINYWGIPDPATLTSSALTLTRRDGATTTTIVATVSRVSGGLIVSVPSLTYSSPTFAMAPVPSVTSVSASTADAGGGSAVVITGRAIRGGSVSFGGTPATSVTYDSATQITAVVPAHAAGTVQLAVTTTGGTAMAPGLFQYTSATSDPPVMLLPTPSTPVPSTSTAPIVSDIPVQLGSSGTVTAPLTLRNGPATVQLPLGTTVRAGGAPFTGRLQPPAPHADPTGKLTNAYDFTTSAGSVDFDRPVTVTLPAPAGADPNDYQPVFVDAAGNLTYLLGRAAGAGIAFDTTHLSLYGLIKIAKPAVVGAAPSVTTQAGYHSRWAGQSAYADVAPGQIVELTARYLNTGDSAWLRGQVGQQAVLGTNAPPDNTRDYDLGVLFAPLYGRNRFATTDTDVQPGGTGTFTFRVRAPLTTGIYRIPVRVLVEGSAWLEDEGVFLQLTVR